MDKKDHSIKFNFKYSKDKIEFFDTFVYKNHENDFVHNTL